MRLLGVDFGGARIGLATYETDFGVGRALPFLTATGTLAKDAVAIAEIAKREQVDRVVIGLPLSRGEETKMSRICRMLGDEVAGLGWDVAFVDEALTSQEAEADMNRAGYKGSERRRRVDGEAALRILERFTIENP